MTRILAACSLVTLAACTTAPDDTGSWAPPCGPKPHPEMQVGNGDHAYGELTDGMDILYGFPPQGGAPYVGFDVRIDGLEQDENGLFVEIIASDPDGDELAYASYGQRFLCGNAGDNAGWLVTNELHLLFFGYTMEALADRAASFEIRAENVAGDSVAFACDGSLVEQ